MTADTDSQLRWRTGLSCADGQCVEVAIRPDIVLMRDSTRPEITISTGHTEWRDFVAKVKRGTFDWGITG